MSTTEQRLYVREKILQELDSIDAELESIEASSLETPLTRETFETNMARQERAKVRLKRVQDLLNSAVPKT
jgi:hypothetical protein